MKKQLIMFCLTGVLLCLGACGGGPSSIHSPSTTRGALITSSLVASQQRIPYFVDAYKITYYTIDTAQKVIRASGLLTVPRKNSGEKSPLLSYQHGTNFLDKDVPSNNATSISAIMTLTGSGYIVSSPDYIGYGESNNTIHPYLHAPSLASASLDMLRASKAFLKKRHVKLNSQLFLAGYSEGGYATLALQKTIQEQQTNEFHVTASAAGAGPFDLSGTSRILANRSTNDNPSYMSFLLKAYNEIYQLKAISDMYQPRYVDIINRSFDGKHSGKTIDEQLSHSSTTLFNQSFLTALQGAGNAIIKEKLALNDLYAWKPDAPTRLYHSPSDEIVPYENAMMAFNTMRSLGVSNISLGTCSAGSHVNCAFPFILDTLAVFCKPC